jgi:IPT/TIG domain-containing protein
MGRALSKAALVSAAAAFALAACSSGGGSSPPPAPAPVISSIAPGGGPAAGGTAVVISGANFQSGATVTMGGAAATVSAVTPTTIAAVTAPHAGGAVTVTVTNPDLQAASLPNGFTYVGPPTHVVTLSWNANHETGVNQAGGGYRIAIGGQPTVVVPWVAGPLAPTSKDVDLAAGTYTVTITAFAALDAQGGATGSASAPSQPITVVVP